MKNLLIGPYNLKYVEAGSGEPMLFLHNAGSGHWIWDHQIRHFAQNYRVFAFDMLGCGASERPDKPYDLDFYTRMTADIIEQLNLKDVTLFGNCVGAAAVLEYASRDSSRVKALVLFNLCGGHHMMTPLVRLVSMPMPQYLKPTHRMILKSFRHAPGVVKAAVRRNYATLPKPADPVYATELKEALNQAQTNSRLNLMQGLATFNKFSHEFARPSHLPPTIVFWGRQNRVLPLVNGLRFCEHLRPAQMHIVEDAGHLPMAEKPGYVNAQIKNFLATLQ